MGGRNWAVLTKIRSVLARSPWVDRESVVKKGAAPQARLLDCRHSRPLESARMRERVSHFWKRVNELLRRRIWEPPELLSASRLQDWAYRQLRVTVIFVQGLARGRIQLRASAMTFTTLLTLGPILVLSLAVFRSFGALSDLETRLEDFLLDNLSPGSQEQVRSWLVQFFAAAEQGAFRELSILVLIGAVVGMLGALEQAFNDIWGVHRGRSFFQRVSIYTTMMVFGPILVGVSLSVTASIETAPFQAWLGNMAPELVGLLELGLRCGAVLLTGLGITLLYTILPNVRVSLRASLPAGLVAAAIWEALKLGYGVYIHTASSYGTLYGSLAAIPFFLMWVYVSWLVVLFGAQLAFAREAAHDFRQEVWAMSAGLRERFRVGMHVAVEVARRYQEELPPPDLVALAQKLRMPVRLVRTVAETLVEGGILHQVSSDQRDSLLVPARAPGRISVYDVYSCIAGNLPDPMEPKELETSPAAAPVDELVEDIDRTIRDKWDGHSLSQVIDELGRSQQQEVFPFPGLERRAPRRDPRKRR